MSLSIVRCALLALLATAPVEGAARAAPPTASVGAAASPADASATTDDITSWCTHPPKSCTVEGNSGTVHALRGLSSTRRRMEAAAADQGLDGSTTSDEDARMALRMQLSRVRLEEAAVGCAQLLRQDGARMERHSSEEWCPLPATCAAIASTDSENGPEKKMECTPLHMDELRQSREALEASLRESMSTSNQEEMMAKQLELAELQAEMASVGCVLMVQYRVESARSSDIVKRNENKSALSGHEHLEGLPLLFHQLQHDEAQFDHFFSPNYQHFLATPETKDLVARLEQTQRGRREIELVLDAAGRGDIPDIVWQERASRERKVEKMKGEELMMRRRLLDGLLQRVESGELTMAELNFQEEKPDEGVEGKRNIWDMLEEHLEREERRRTGSQKQKENEGDGVSHQPRFASSSHQECNDNGSEETCASGPYPSPAVVTAMDEMRRDVELLRKKKAAEASSEAEREARLGLVRQMERRLEAMVAGQRRDEKTA